MSESAMSPVEVERWLPAPDWDGLYEVSDHGRVRSLPRKTVSGRRGGRILKPTADRAGYWRVNFSQGKGRVGNYQVHRLVAIAFLGPIPPGMEVLHGPAGSQVNHVSNLSIGTHRENIHDKFRDGTIARGERHGMTTLTEADVLEIRRRYAAGESSKGLGRALGLDSTGLANMISGVTWAHVPGAIPMRVSRGEVLPQAKLGASDIPTIRARCAAGELQKNLAIEYGVCQQTISNIIRGRIWRHVA